MRSIARICTTAFLFLALVLGAAFGQEGKDITKSNQTIPANARIYVAPMEDGFDTFLTAAIMKKKVPVVVTTDKTKADYEITGISNSEKAGWAKMFFMSSDSSREQASIKVVNAKSGEVVYGYAVHKGNSYRGRQSAAEACAKHLKEKIEGK